MTAKRTVLLLAGLAFSTNAMASVVTRMDTRTLVRLSPVIVRGTVVSVTSVLAGEDARLYTDVSVQVIERLRGPEGRDAVTVRLLGGSLEGRAARVYGTPEFEVGEEVVLFARPTKSGWLTVTGLFQGKVDVEREAGKLFAVRHTPSDRDRVWVVGGAETSRRMPLDAFVSEVRALTATAPALASSDVDVEAEGTTDSRNFTFLLIPLRRFEPDSNLPIVYRYNPLGAPAVAGGARAAFESALDAWNGASGHDVTLQDGGNTAAQCYLTFDGITGVSHGDPCGEVPAFDTGTCSGVLAIGGMSEINPFAFVTRNGKLFLQGLQGDVVLNSGAECFFTVAGNYEEVLTHEIGHTLGLGHSCGDANSPACSSSAELDEAQMRATAHADGRGASLRRDDVKGVRFIYPPNAFVELRGNDVVFGPGEALDVTLDLNGRTTADFWLFTIRPDGTVALNLRQPNVPLAFYVDLPLVRHTFTGAEPPGRYYMFAILGRPGSTLSVASDVLSFSYVAFDFAP